MTWPSTVSLSFSQTHTRVPTILTLKVFHSPTGLSALTSGHFPGLSGVVVPQGARSLRRAVLDLARIVGIPDLDLRACRAGRSRIAVVADHQPIDVELEVAVVLGRREVRTLSVGDDFVLGDVDAPVRSRAVFHCRLLRGVLVGRELRLFAGL